MSIKARAALLAAMIIALCAGLAPGQGVTRAAPAQPATLAPEQIGVVIRDPSYEHGTNPRYPGQPNYEAIPFAAS